MKMLKLGDDQWVRSDRITNVGFQKQIVYVYHIDGPAMICDFNSNKGAETAAEAFVAELNAALV